MINDESTRKYWYKGWNKEFEDKYGKGGKRIKWKSEGWKTSWIKKHRESIGCNQQWIELSQWTWRETDFYDTKVEISTLVTVWV